MHGVVNMCMIVIYVLFSFQNYNINRTFTEDCSQITNTITIRAKYNLLKTTHNYILG